MKQQYPGDNEVEARPVEIKPTEIAAANLDHLTGERLDPVRLQVHGDNDPPASTRSATA